MFDTKSNRISQLYCSYMEGITSTVKFNSFDPQADKQVLKDLQKTRENCLGDLEFCKEIFKTLQEFAEMREDVMLMSIVKGTQNILGGNYARPTGTGIRFPDSYPSSDHQEYEEENEKKFSKKKAPSAKIDLDGDNDQKYKRTAPKITKRPPQSSWEECKKPSDNKSQDSKIEEKKEFDEWTDDENAAKPTEKEDFGDWGCGSDLDQYLKVEDIQKDDKFEKIYIDSVDEKFENAVTYINQQTLVGLDTEFFDKGATYIQISTLEKGFVFNLNKLRFEEKVRSFFQEFCLNPKIEKVGFSIQSDTKEIRRAFQNQFEDLQGFFSFEEKLTLSRTSNNMGLTGFCNRVFGKHLNKDLQNWVAESQELDEDEIEYCILDALAPLTIYYKLEKAIKLSNSGCLVSPNMPEKPVFFVDTMCKLILKDLDDNCLQSVYLDSKNTYEGKKILSFILRYFEEGEGEWRVCGAYIH